MKLDNLFLLHIRKGIFGDFTYFDVCFTTIFSEEEEKLLIQCFCFSVLMYKSFSECLDNDIYA